MEWKNKFHDACCADELEEMIRDEIKAGFLSDDEILEDCEEHLEDDYPEECDTLSEDDFLEIIEAFRSTYGNTGSQENFLKLDAAFDALTSRGIVALHYAGYTQSEGFEDCAEVRADLEEEGIKVIGCCFYSEQDLGHILHEESTQLYLSFGACLDEPTSEEIGQIIVEELQKAGFEVQWNQSADTKIAIQNLTWDKYYTECE